jgi:Glycogen recognition site of AMP-activated protein kinase
VYITGTFNNWEKQIPMHRSGNDFTYIHDLKKGKHAFKFIVDGERTRTVARSCQCFAVQMHMCSSAD